MRRTATRVAGSVVCMSVCLNKLFTNVMYNKQRVLHPTLPGTMDTKYHLRLGPHNFKLTTKITECDFITRMLSEDVYWHYAVPSVLWRCWLSGRKGIRPAKKTEWWGTGVVICLERGADLHMAQLMPLPLTVSCFSKIQIGLTFLVTAYPRCPRKEAVKWLLYYWHYACYIFMYLRSFLHVSFFYSPLFYCMFSKL